VSISATFVEDNDIHGDGVNIAARLEAIAEPGGSCMSEDAYRQVRGKVDAEFSDICQRDLKNIARPLGVYRVSSGSPAATTMAAALPLPDKPSIAVLPFANMSGD
jgi:adenylate cyclase